MESEICVSRFLSRYRNVLRSSFCNPFLHFIYENFSLQLQANEDITQIVEILTTGTDKWPWLTSHLVSFTSGTATIFLSLIISPLLIFGPDFQIPREVITCNEYMKFVSFELGMETIFSVNDPCNSVLFKPEIFRPKRRLMGES